MNRLINFIGIVVLCGILLKLSYVFVYLFGELDAGNWLSRITGITFAFASIYFVVKVRYNWLKAVMVVLDVFTILYFYLHERMRIPIDYASVIVAAYSGLIIYYLGKMVGDRLTIDSESTANRQRSPGDGR
jgi:nicotinamide riboside transporter PnuC